MKKWLYYTISCDSEFLTSEEIVDVLQSFKEIEIGDYKRFSNVKDFLRELKK